MQELWHLFCGFILMCLYSGWFVSILYNFYIISDFINKNNIKDNALGWGAICLFMVAVGLDYPRLKREARCGISI